MKDGVYNNIIIEAENSSGQPIKHGVSINLIAKWFLNKSALTNKKLQKLCYYAYCWYIVFFNDLEAVNENRSFDINVLCSESFQAWIHGPVSPTLYQKYKTYGWLEIPKEKEKPIFTEELESLLQQVWDAYGSLTADELEAISHSEPPWKNARQGILACDPCTNVISNYDILQYYSTLS